MDIATPLAAASVKSMERVIVSNHTAWRDRRRRPRPTGRAEGGEGFARRAALTAPLPFM
jgi:hypothetical protein